MASEMALAYLGMHDFAASGNVKTALGRFMCPNLGHWEPPLLSF
jgi:hypothetical protein